jgi:L-alanine-DL-glutamate epimerase-like enolase superfamily enzyme
MRITSIESRSYVLPLDPPFAAAWDPVPRAAFPETIVTVRTDEGITGNCGGAPVPDLSTLERLLVGLDPTDTNPVFAICETVDFHGGRNWTVEVAVWDLIAKAAGQPLWKFLGGERDRCKAYASSGERVDASERAERLLEWKQRGIGAAKIRFHAPDWRDDLRVVEQCRSVVGPDFELMVDANQGWRMPGDLTPRWDLAMAADCAAALSELNIYWLEEPLDTHAVDDYFRLRESTSMRIAAGEMIRCLPESRHLLTAGGVDVIQNDVVLAGGITGCRAVAGWAKAAGADWSPHTWSSGYGLVANLHAALAMSTGEYLEVPYDPPAWSVDRRDFMLPAGIDIDRDGYVAAPAGPGLGVEPDLDALERWRVA